MIQRELHIPYEWHDDTGTLAPEERDLLQAALAATAHSYAPYSKFRVGCALGLANGETVLGSNQENAAYPSGLCAERVACFAAGAAGKGKLIRTVAIRAISKKFRVDQPPTSCGDCRQVMLEFERQAESPFTVLFQGETGPVLRVSGIAGGLVPFPFDFNP